MTTVILVIHLMLAIALICVVLLQQSEGGGFRHRWRVWRRRYGRLYDQPRYLKFIDPRDSNYRSSLYGHESNPRDFGRWRQISSAIDYRPASKVADGASESTGSSRGSRTTSIAEFAASVN